MFQPLVSIVIPVYNGANYLKYAIDSALNQTYSNCEILVVNDGSQDNGATESIALSYGDRIRYFSKENGGVATALNLGIQSMKGDYFSWLSHDDMYYPEKVELEIDALLKNGEMTSIVFSDYEILNMNTQNKSYTNFEKLYAREKMENSVFSLLQGLVHGCSLLIHKSHFKRVGVFDESLITTQDYDLWFRMFRHQKLMFVNKPLVIGRMHDNQGSRTIGAHMKEQSELHIRFMDLLEKEEVSALYPSPYMFYYEMIRFFGRNGIMGAYDYAYQLFMKEEIPEEASKKIKEFKEYLHGLSDEKAEKLCIFCAGEYGMNLHQDLYCRLIRPDFFSDNNPKKWGYILDGIYCVPPIELDKKNTLLIVAIKEPDEIVRQLKEKGFQYVTTKSEVEHFMEKVPPVKWLVETKQYEKVDYSSDNMIQLIDKFNKTLFEVCQYYEKPTLDSERDNRE